MCLTGSSKDSPYLTLPFSPSVQPLDRDQPNGRPQWRFTVFAQDEGGEGLVGYADVQVNLKDINDNAPIFPQGVYFGNVTENGTAGLWGTAVGANLTGRRGSRNVTFAPIKFSCAELEIRAQVSYRGNRCSFGALCD